MIVKGGGSKTAPGAGPPGYVSNWWYPPQSGLMDPGTTTLTTTTTRLYYIPMYIFESRKFDFMAAYNSGAGDSGDAVRLGIYSHNTSYGPRTLMNDFGSVTLGASAAKLANTTADEVALPRGWYWLAVHCNGAADMYAIRSRVASYGLAGGQQDFGTNVLDATGLDCVNYFPYVDTAVAAFATNAVAPTSVTSIVPKVWLQAV